MRDEYWECTEWDTVWQEINLVMEDMGQVPDHGTDGFDYDCILLFINSPRSIISL